MSYFDLGRWGNSDGPEICMVYDGTVHFENQKSKILAPPCSCVTLNGPSTFSIL